MVKLDCFVLSKHNTYMYMYYNIVLLIPSIFFVGLILGHAGGKAAVLEDRFSQSRVSGSQIFLLL